MDMIADQEAPKGIDDLLLSGRQPEIIEGDELDKYVADLVLMDEEEETTSTDEIAEESGLPELFIKEGRTDLANARRLIAVHGNKLKFCHAWGKWLIWDGRRWAVDENGSVYRLAKNIADQIWRVATMAGDYDIEKWAKRTSSKTGLSAMLSLAESEVPITVDEMDSNAWLLNCQNGTVDLQTGELHAHRREDLLTRLCPTEFNPESSSDVWDNFLESVFVQTSLIDFVQRLLGYAITGDVSEQILPILWGSGSNGKSTLIDAVTNALGKDYAGTLPRSMLMVTKGERHPTELTTLYRKRLMIAHETDDGARLSESLVKQLTGGDAITARGMHQDFWEFQPSHKLLMLTNHKPQVRGTDHAIWRRLRLVPFTERFEGERKDKSMPEKLEAQAAGILAWLVRGCLQWQAEGLNEPEAVKVATAEYRSSEDALAAFIDDYCLTGRSEYKVRSTDIYKAYQSWTDSVGERAISQRKFGESITERGFEKTKSNGVWYLGIAINSEFNRE